MSRALSSYNVLNRLPFGKFLFSKAVCFTAPYFRSIKPRFVELKPGYCEIKMKKRRAVLNHLKSVHAIAMCNLCELAGGTALDVTIPGHMRWIPRGMQVKYLKMAKTDLMGTCTIRNDEVQKPGSVPVTVHVTDRNGIEVMTAVIDMHITERK
ncbi:MAG: DUF4442 domain-containing protein [Spirochaetes bacterium]|jgi:acyl-coenzyme A thioesterase PaaI-like protein|nr:DUF4442 domain-containing protein [Spirochaetota bacterium]